MVDRKRVPWPLWLFCATMLAGSVVIEVRAHSGFITKALFALLVLVWIYHLLKGIQWVWILTVAISVLAIAPYAFMTPFDWPGLVGSLVALALLLLPMTRRYFANDIASG